MAIKAWHPHQPDYVVTHSPTIAVQNNCANSAVKLSPAVPVDGWFTMAGKVYTQGMVVPYVTDFMFDFSKLTISQSKCLAMSTDSKLRLFFESASCDDPAITILDANQNAYVRVPMSESFPNFNYSWYTNL